MADPTQSQLDLADKRGLAEYWRCATTTNGFFSRTSRTRTMSQINREATASGGRSTNIMNANLVLDRQILLLSKVSIPVPDMQEDDDELARALGVDITTLATALHRIKSRAPVMSCEEATPETGPTVCLSEDCPESVLTMAAELSASRIDGYSYEDYRKMTKFVFRSKEDALKVAVEAACNGVGNAKPARIGQ